MALNSLTYHTNAIVGDIRTGSDINIYDTHTSSAPRFAVGSGFIRADGNKYRYSWVQATTTAGRMLAPAFASSGLASQSSGVVASTTAVAVPGEAPILPGQVGSRYIEITLASTAAQIFAGSYLILQSGSGAGFTYRIKGNTATGNPAAGNVRVELYETLKVVVSPNTNFIITPNPFNDLIVCSSATNWASSGVLASTTGASAQYAWVCTHGTIGVLQDGTVTGGDQLSISKATNGALASTVVSGTGFGASHVVGYCIQPGANAALMSAYIQLE